MTCQVIRRQHQEKRPLVRAFGKGVGPEFEDSTRSGCRRDRQPLQASRLPTSKIVCQLAVYGYTKGKVPPKEAKSPGERTEALTPTGLSQSTSRYCTHKLGPLECL